MEAVELTLVQYCMEPIRVGSFSSLIFLINFLTFQFKNILSEEDSSSIVGPTAQLKTGPCGWTNSRVPRVH